jgi:hypothetical protein
MYRSGETVYRTDYQGISSRLDDVQDLRKFLDFDVDIDHKLVCLKERLEKVRERRVCQRTSLTSLKTCLESTSDLIQKERSRLLEEIQLSNKVSGNYLDSFLDDRDTLLMKIVLKYFSVLVSERNSYLEQLRRDSILCDVSRRHCIINRDIQVPFRRFVTTLCNFPWCIV